MLSFELEQKLAIASQNYRAELGVYNDVFEEVTKQASKHRDTGCEQTP